MHVLRSREVAEFSAAVERIHSETDLAGFPQRMFSVLEELLPNIFITVDEFHIASGASRNVSNRPTPDGWVERLRELAPAEHPGYFALEKGIIEPLRLEDLISQRALQKTNLHHEIFRPMEIRHQIVLPLRVAGHVAAFTLNRDRAFTDAELCLARMLGPHLALAHFHAQNSTALAAFQSTRSAQEATVGTLTAREFEVLHWVSQGKRDSEIAQILGIARRTASKHVQNILDKLGVETRGAAAAAIRE